MAKVINIVKILDQHILFQGAIRGCFWKIFEDDVLRPFEGLLEGVLGYQRKLVRTSVIRKTTLREVK